jgi:heptosyltransferase-2
MNDKILIVGPAWVGDMVMAQCLFKLLKQHQPGLIIDVLAPTWSLPLLARMPEVASAIAMPVGHGQLDLRARYRLGKSLRNQGYKQAIVLPNSFKSALIPFFAKIPVRTGWRGEMRYGVLNDVRILDEKRYPLMIERFMALGILPNENLPNVYPKPQLQISVSTCEQALSNHQLKKSQRSILALCPGAEFGPAKRWPEEYYAAIANAKLKEDWEVWIFGSPKDGVVAERIMELTQYRCVNLTGKTKLEEAVDLLSLASVVVSNDSGLMHIAAAMNKPLIVIYGPTSAGFTPPLNDKAKILALSLECQPCFKRECPLQHHLCMVELKPETVLKAMDELIL